MSRNLFHLEFFAFIISYETCDSFIISLGNSILNKLNPFPRFSAIDEILVFLEANAPSDNKIF